MCHLAEVCDILKILMQLVLEFLPTNICRMVRQSISDMWYHLLMVLLF